MTVKPEGVVDVKMAGAATPGVEAYGYVSQDWAVANGYPAFVATNYSEETFKVWTQGEVEIRKSLTIGNVGGSGANIPGVLKCIGNSNVSGLASDKAIEVEFDSTSVFEVDHSGKLKATIYDLDSLPSLP